MYARLFSLWHVLHIPLFFMLLIAGIDTTWSAIGSSLWHLAKTPADRDRLIAEPELLPTAIEELLRAYSPVTMAREVTQQRLGNFRVKIRLHADPQHSGSNRHVEKLDPKLHLIESRAHVAGTADDLRGEFRWRRHLSAQLVAQQTMVEALHGGQQREFPLGILNHSQLLRNRALRLFK